MRAIVAIAGFATFLLAVAAAAALVGVHDATLTDADAGVATTSAALVVLSATLAVAAAELLAMSRRRTWERGVRPPCKLPVLIAFLFTFFLGVYVLFSTLRSGGDQWPVVVAVPRNW